MQSLLIMHASQLTLMLTRENTKKKTNLYNKRKKRILKGRIKKNPLNVRSKSLGTKNDLSCSRSSNRRTHTGRGGKREKKKEKTYKGKTNKQKKTKMFSFLLLQFNEPVPDV